MANLAFRFIHVWLQINPCITQFPFVKLLLIGHCYGMPQVHANALKDQVCDWILKSHTCETIRECLTYLHTWLGESASYCITLPLYYSVN